MYAPGLNIDKNKMIHDSFPSCIGDYSKPNHSSWRTIIIENCRFQSTRGDTWNCFCKGLRQALPRHPSQDSLIPDVRFSNNTKTSTKCKWREYKKFMRKSKWLHSMEIQSGLLLDFVIRSLKPWKMGVKLKLFRFSCRPRVLIHQPPPSHFLLHWENLIREPHFAFTYCPTPRRIYLATQDDTNGTRDIAHRSSHYRSRDMPRTRTFPYLFLSLYSSSSTSSS